MKDYSCREVGMLIGVGIGGSAAVALFSFTRSILSFTAAVVGITAGIVIGRKLDRKRSKSSGKEQ